jgi:hypothetical protein
VIVPQPKRGGKTDLGTHARKSAARVTQVRSVRSDYASLQGT